MDRARALYVAAGLAERGVQFFSGLQKKRQLDRLALLNNLGRLQLAAGRPARVDEVCKKLEAAIPNDHFALPYLVALLELLGKRKKIKSLAQKHCTDEVAAEIRADVACGVARAYRDEGRASRARQTVEVALQLAPFHRGLAELRAVLVGVDDGLPVVDEAPDLSDA
jgi:tetratricopeptide (TPR) repeat protein